MRLYIYIETQSIYFSVNTDDNKLDSVIHESSTHVSIFKSSSQVL